MLLKIQILYAHRIPFINFSLTPSVDTSHSRRSHTDSKAFVYYRFFCHTSDKNQLLVSSFQNPILGSFCRHLKVLWWWLFVMLGHALRLVEQQLHIWDISGLFSECHLVVMISWHLTHLGDVVVPVYWLQSEPLIQLLWPLSYRERMGQLLVPGPRLQPGSSLKQRIHWYFLDMAWSPGISS